MPTNILFFSKSHTELDDLVDLAISSILAILRSQIQMAPKIYLLGLQSYETGIKDSHGTSWGLASDDDAVHDRNYVAPE